MTDDDPSGADPGADEGDAPPGSTDAPADPEDVATDADAPADLGDDPSADDTWSPDEVSSVDAFDDGGEADGDSAVVSAPGEFLQEDHWFEDERDVPSFRGMALLLSAAGAGLYASSFVFAAVGLRFVAPPAAETYVDLLLNAVFFLPIPMLAYLAAGVGLEAYAWRSGGEIPETSLPIALVVPVVLHVSLFFVEWVEFGYTSATLADLFAREPGLAQLLLWPPVVVGTIFAVVVYRASLADLAPAEESIGLTRTP